MNAVNDQERDIDNPANPYGNYVPDPGPGDSCQTLQQNLDLATELQQGHAALEGGTAGNTRIQTNYVNGYDKKIKLYTDAMQSKGCAVTSPPVPVDNTTGTSNTTTTTTTAATNFIQQNPLIVAAGTLLLLIFLTRKK